MTAAFTPIDFQTIEQYKAWRTNWKQQYNTLSEEIRAAKQDVREKQREHSFALYGSGGTTEQRVAITKAMSALWSSLGALGRLRTTACAALDLRSQSKVKSAQLYILEHRVETNSEI